MDEENGNATATANYAYYYAYNYYTINYVGPLAYVEVWVNRTVPAVSIFVCTPLTVLIVLTLAFNSLSLTKRVRFYYMTIAIMDCASILTFHLSDYIGFVIRPTDASLALPFNNEFLCKLSRWIWFSSLLASAFATMMFSIERYYKIRDPWSTKFSRFSRRMVLATAVGIALLFCSYGYLFVVTRTPPIAQPPYHYCAVDSSTSLGLTATFFITCSGLASVFGELACNVLLFVTLERISRDRLRTFDSAQLSSVSATAVTVIVHGALHVTFYLPECTLWLLYVLLHIVQADIYAIMQVYYAGMITLFSGPPLIISVNFVMFVTKIRGFKLALVRLLTCRCNTAPA